MNTTPESKALDATLVRPKPVAGETRPYSFPSFQSTTLDNGLRVISAPIHSHPVVTVLAVVDAGAGKDPEGLHGLAVLTARALSEGTRSMSSLELAERVESIGTVLDTGADWDSSIVQLTALSEKTSDSLEVLSEVLQYPSFPRDEMQRIVEERLSDLTQIRAEPRGLADMALARMLYSESCRYSRLAAGDEISITSITHENIVSFHADHFQPGSTTLLVVGDCSAESAFALADKHLGSWSSKNHEVVSTPEAVVGSEERRIQIVDKPDAQQTELRIGHVAVPRLHPDYFPLVVMNAILGGLFSSRLNLNLREKHGYTYGAHSSFDWRRSASPFEISSAVQTDKCADSIKEALKEIDRIRNELVDEEELSLAVSYLDGVFPIRFETTAAVAGGLANVEIFRLPDDYFDSYRFHVRSVTREQLLAAAQNHLNPDALQIVAVGPAEILKPALENIDCGSVHVSSAESLSAIN